MGTHPSILHIWIPRKVYPLLFSTFLIMSLCFRLIDKAYKKINSTALLSNTRKKCFTTSLTFNLTHKNQEFIKATQWELMQFTTAQGLFFFHSFLMNWLPWWNTQMSIRPQEIGPKKEENIDYYPPINVTLYNSCEWLTNGGFGWRAQAIDAGSVLRLWSGEHEKQVGPTLNWKHSKFNCGPRATSAWSSWPRHFRFNLRLRQENKQPVTSKGFFLCEDAVTSWHWATLRETYKISYFMSCQKELKEAERHREKGGCLSQLVESQQRPTFFFDQWIFSDQWKPKFIPQGQKLQSTSCHVE